MAGAGYKLFNTGDVLTAAQVNTYLNEQTVMVFASSAARTSALSGVLAEGMVSYLQDTNAVEVYNGSAWVGVSGAGDVTEVQAGTGISVASGTGPIPVVSFDYRAGSAVTFNAQTATYTGVLTDADQKLVTMSNAAANDFLIPTNANVAFPVGTVINVLQIGAGQTTIKAVTSGTTTINSTGASATAPKLRARYSAASCIKSATDTWYVVGDIA
jgi:hypothetical protein